MAEELVSAGLLPRTLDRLKRALAPEATTRERLVRCLAEVGLRAYAVHCMTTDMDCEETGINCKLSSILLILLLKAIVGLNATFLSNGKHAWVQIATSRGFQWIETTSKLATLVSQHNAHPHSVVESILRAHVCGIHCHCFLDAAPRNRRCRCYSSLFHHYDHA